MRTPHSIAAAVAVVVAWRTESMIATIAVGLGVLWFSRSIVAGAGSPTGLASLGK